MKTPLFMEVKKEEGEKRKDGASSLVQTDD